MKKMPLLSFALWLSMACICAKAAVLSQYGFESGFAASYADPAISANDFSYGLAITSVQLENDGQPANSWLGETWTTSDDPQVALDSDSYASFQITTQPNYLISLTKLTLDVRPHGSGPQDFVVQVIDLSNDFRSQFGSILFHSDRSTFDPGRKSWETLSATSGSFQNLSGEYEVRVYGYDANQANREVLFDNVTLEGTITSIPEPSVFMLLVVGTGLFFCIRRRV